MWCEPKLGNCNSLMKVFTTSITGKYPIFSRVTWILSNIIQSYNNLCVYLCGQCRHCSVQPQEAPLGALSNWSPDSGMQHPVFEVHAHGSLTWQRHSWAPQNLASWHRGSGTLPASHQTENKKTILDSFLWFVTYIISCKLRHTSSFKKMGRCAQTCDWYYM